MKFSMTGWLGSRITLTWDEGKLQVDPPTLQPVIEQIIQEYEDDGFVVGEVGGPTFSRNYLDHPYTAYLIFNEILRDIEQAPDPEDLRGDLPKYTSVGLMTFDENRNP
ncbi:hypothetical protein [Laceyella putida]|uniref:Uncharacterized protein n=1 Tax=Laceyella putida TaxID=110101 RepID=A0ABW2RQY5_9BACL